MSELVEELILVNSTVGTLLNELTKFSQIIVPALDTVSQNVSGNPPDASTWFKHDVFEMALSAASLDKKIARDEYFLLVELLYELRDMHRTTAHAYLEKVDISTLDCGADWEPGIIRALKASELDGSRNGLATALQVWYRVSFLVFNCDGPLSQQEKEFLQSLERRYPGYEITSSASERIAESQVRAEPPKKSNHRPRSESKIAEQSEKPNLGQVDDVHTSTSNDLLLNLLEDSREQLDDALSTLLDVVPEFEGLNEDEVYWQLVYLAVAKFGAGKRPSRELIELLCLIVDRYDLDLPSDKRSVRGFIAELEPDGKEPLLIDAMEQLDAQLSTRYAETARKVYGYLKEHFTIDEADIPAAIVPANTAEQNCSSKCDVAQSNNHSTGNDQILAELNALVGLNQIKQDVLELLNFLSIQQLRKQKGLPVTPVSRHLVFSGNPGTGKTTVARLLAKIYRSAGVISKDHLTEADRSALVGGYLGQTAIKVNDIVKKSLGGVLFIDEAYTLAADQQDAFGQEAIDTLLKLMEDNREDLIVIVAGYPEKMNKFISANPGLRSRFNKFFVFEDYSPPEMFEIFRNLCTTSGFRLTESASERLNQVLTELHLKRNDQSGNGRDVRNIFERAITNQANRIVSLIGTDAKTHTLEELTFEDIPFPVTH